MDIQLKKRPWYVRYRLYLVFAALFTGFAVWVLARNMGPKRLRIDPETVRIAEVKQDRFLEYVEAEAVVQPIMTLQVNAREKGSIVRIAQEEGALVRQGDTLLVLSNPALEREIEEMGDALEKQLMAYTEQELEMQQRRLALQQQALSNDYEQERLRRQNQLDHEEYDMGTRSKAQLEISDAEYKYKSETARLARESLRHDSAMAVIRAKLVEADRKRETERFARARTRLDDLAVLAPTDGQVSYANLIPGQIISAGEKVADIKVMSAYKLHTCIGEYYMDRVVTGLPARATDRQKQYPLRVAKVVPEVKDRAFQVDLTFTGELPENLRIGKSMRVQVELGQPETATVIPRGDFFSATGGRWIFLVTEDRKRAVRTPIQIARQNPTQFEVAEGLKPGDRIVVSGYSAFGEAEEINF